MNTKEFLKNASSKTKNMGNNRYQDEIKNLNDKIHKMSKSIDDKNEELNLFKRNFTDIQIQLQEKNIKITESNNKLTKAENEIKELNNNILNINNINLTLISNLEKDKQKNQNEKDEYINNFNVILNDKNDLQYRYDDIKIKYKETLLELDSKINILEDLNTKYTINLREFNLLKELNNTKINELDSMKQELYLANNHINSLKIILIEKDTLLREKEKQLKDIDSRLENNMFKYNMDLNKKIGEEIGEEENQTIQQEENKTIQQEENKTDITNLVVKRGLKVSRR